MAELDRERVEELLGESIRDAQRMGLALGEGSAVDDPLARHARLCETFFDGFAHHLDAWANDEDEVGDAPLGLVTLPAIAAAAIRVLLALRPDRAEQWWWDLVQRSANAHLANAPVEGSGIGAYAAVAYHLHHASMARRAIDSGEEIPAVAQVCEALRIDRDPQALLVASYTYAATFALAGYAIARTVLEASEG